MSGPRFQVGQVWAQRSGKHVHITEVVGSYVGYEYVGVTPSREGRSYSDNARRNWTFVGTFVGCT